MSHVHAGPAEDDKEVHTIDTDAWVILDAKINVLLDTETEVSVFREVLSSQLVLLYLQSSLENLLGLG